MSGKKTWTIHILVQPTTWTIDHWEHDSDIGADEDEGDEDDEQDVEDEEENAWEKEEE